MVRFSAPRVFWSRARDLTPEWQFLYLSFHAAYHRWNSLKWLADIHDLCLSTNIDWAQVKDKAERFELDTFAGPTLAVCSSLFGTPIPADSPRAFPPIFRFSRTRSRLQPKSTASCRRASGPATALRWSISNGGVPLESRHRLMPGMTVELYCSRTAGLGGGARPRAWCGVARLRANEVSYRGAIAFEHYFWRF